MRLRAPCQVVASSSHSRGPRSTPSNRRVYSRTASSPRSSTSSRMRRTASRVSGSLPARRGSSGSSASKGGTASTRIIRGPRGNTFGVLHLKRMESAASPAIGLGLVSVVVLVLANAFFVAAEFALVGARRTRLDEMARAGDGKARLARRAVQSLDRYISATQLGITLASLGLGWIGEPALAGLIEGGFRWLPGHAWRPSPRTAVASIIAFIIITILHIILGELVPKALALLYPETVSTWVAAPLIGFAWAMAWPIAFLNGTANWLLRLMRISPPGEHERLHSPEEIRMLVEQSTEGGSLLKEDARLLEGVFEFSEKTAQEVMTPRTQMVALDSSLTVEEAADEVAVARRSRYPVYTESLDEIVGVVHAKDILTRAPRAATRDRA